MQARIAALVVAAGRGHRVGEDLPKQYAALSNQDDTVLRRAVEAFVHSPLVDDVQVVIHPDDRALYDRSIGMTEALEPVPGGASRQQSVLCGLEALTSVRPSLVLIHDAARPFVSQVTIAQVIGALAVSDGAIAAVPVTDTLKHADANGFIAGTRDRSGLWQAQTPQGFKFDAILTAHRAAAGSDLTDDAAIAEQSGISVRLVPDRRDNVKITTADDLSRARELARGRSIHGGVRVGHGFDTHRCQRATDADRSLVLCGVAVPAPFVLAGHSDADVGLHALADAIFGACADGDIGLHFPPSDQRWRDASSDQFVHLAAARCRADGCMIAHVDITVICEQPKIGPYRDAMRTTVADIVGIPVAQVSIKATTTERLGYTGRGEGIAALATATVVRNSHV